MIIERIKAFFGGDARSREYYRSIRRIGREASEIGSLKRQDGRLRILYGPSFSIYQPCYVHDMIFSASLRLRGTEVIPIYCDQVQHTECNCIGGVWGGGSKFSGNCQRCSRTSRRLWQRMKLEPLPFSSFISNDALRKIEDEVAALRNGEWASYVVDDLPFGHWAKDILVNNYVVGDHRLIEGHERLGRAHLRNLLIVRIAYQAILDTVQPDRVVTNDSYYGMWAILQKLCEQQAIPFYSHWSGTRPGAWCYAYNDASMNLDYRPAWPAFSSQQLSDAQKQTVDAWLSGRLSGQDMILDTASLAPHCNEEADLSKIREGRPTAILASNVIWDLAALNKQVVFEDMIDWIAGTITWFGGHPEYQLIVKPHPGEQNPSIPETEERIGPALRKRGVIIPNNVVLLSPKAAITVYQLLPLVKVGIMHTTTVGVEMAARGIPVITSARSPYRGFGFTLDPSTKNEYFTVLKSVLQGDVLLERKNQIDLTYKFILFQQFHYYTKIDIMDYRWGETPRIKVKSLDDIRPGRNHHLDYIVDSVMTGLPIVSEDRWPEES